MGRARLRRDDRRSEPLRLYYTPPDIAALRALARAQGLDLREWVYRAVETAKAAATPPEPVGASS